MLLAGCYTTTTRRWNSVEKYGIQLNRCLITFEDIFICNCVLPSRLKQLF